MIRAPAILCVAMLLAGVGCASYPAGVTDASMRPDDYPGLFDAARQTLTEYRFTIDRVDAARGVITTRPKGSAGLATPWDREQSSFGQRAEDLMHQQERIVRVTFEPAESPTRVGVEVVVQRVRRPNWRVETDAIATSTHARDPLAQRAGSAAEYREPMEEDRRLATRLLARIHEIAGLAPETATAHPPDAAGSGT